MTTRQPRNYFVEQASGALVAAGGLPVPLGYVTPSAFFPTRDEALQARRDYFSLTGQRSRVVTYNAAAQLELAALPEWSPPKYSAHSVA